MALAKVQTTPKSLSNITTVTVTFSTQPIVGNAIVFVLSQQTGSIVSVTDNQGNTYELVLTKVQSSVIRATVYFCQTINTTGTPFTITATSSGANQSLTCVAIEVSGTAGQLRVDRSISNGAVSTTPSTGTTAALRTTTDAFIVALLSSNAAQSAITVESVSPSWTQEHESLIATGGNTPSESDSRIVTSATGTTQSCSWAAFANTIWAALLVAFGDASSVPFEGRVTQDVIEVLSLPVPDARITQNVIEVLSATTPVPGRVSQYVVEILSGGIITPPTVTETTQFFVILP